MLFAWNCINTHISFFISSVSCLDFVAIILISLVSSFYWKRFLHTSFNVRKFAHDKRQQIGWHGWCRSKVPLDGVVIAHQTRHTRHVTQGNHLSWCDEANFKDSFTRRFVSARKHFTCINRAHLCHEHYLLFFCLFWLVFLRVLLLLFVLVTYRVCTLVQSCHVWLNNTSVLDRQLSWLRVCSRYWNSCSLIDSIKCNTIYTDR